jgi:hypothetical protein
VREGVGEGGRNDPSLVCTYKYNKKEEKTTQVLIKNFK